MLSTWHASSCLPYEWSEIALTQLSIQQAKQHLSYGNQSDNYIENSYSTVQTFIMQKNIEAGKLMLSIL